MAVEVLVILESLLVRQWSAWDGLLRARVAIAANQPRITLEALKRIADVVPKQRGADALVASALAVADSLPEEMAQEVREKLRARPRAAPR